MLILVKCKVQDQSLINSLSIFQRTPFGVFYVYACVFKCVLKSQIDVKYLMQSLSTIFLDERLLSELVAH